MHNTHFETLRVSMVQFQLPPLRHNHTERQEERQAARQASVAEAVPVSPMQVYGDASLDAPNGSQIHCINLTLHA